MTSSSSSSSSSRSSQIELELKPLKEEGDRKTGKTHNLTHSDELLKMGRYSIVLCLFVEVAMLSQLSNTMLMVYAGAPPLITSCGNQTFSTNEQACAHYAKCKEHPENMTFSRQFYGISEQFRLLCDEAKVEKLGTSVQMIGVMLGCLVFGQIGDQYGRKMPMMLCLCMCFVFGVMSALSSDFRTFTMFRTVLCFFNGGQSTISVVYMIENIPKRTRMYVSTLISYSPNVILLGCLAFLFQEWSQLALAISFLTVPAIVMLAFLHESPRWLMQKGRVEKAKKVFLAIEKFDGVTPSESLDADELESFLEEEHEKQVSTNARVGKQHSFWHLFETREIMTGTFVIAFTFFATTLINYSIMFNLGAVAGSIYMNSILIGLLRYSISLCSGFLDYKFEQFNRKVCHGVCSLSTIAFIVAIIAFCLTETTVTFATVIRAGVLLTCAMTSQAIIVASITSNELMPTAIRSISYSTAQLCSRFGIVVAPHIFHLNLYTGIDFPLLPYAILLVIGLADFFFFRFLIPETKNKPLEDFIVNNRTKSVVSNDK